MSIKKWQWLVPAYATWTRVNDDVLTNGKKMMLTISSIFSAILVARSPSCGIITPAKKPPKMAWTPMISVTKAEASTMTSVTVINNGVGPFWMDPVAKQRRRYNGRTRKMRKRAKARVVRSTQRTSKPLPALRRATTSASNTLVSFLVRRAWSQMGWEDGITLNNKVDLLTMQ